jgi:hypothetical protein
MATEIKSFIAKNDATIKLTNNTVVDFYLHGNWIYQIFIDEIGDSLQALSWCRQLSEKTWMRPELLSRFCSMAIIAIENNKRSAAK